MPDRNNRDHRKLVSVHFSGLLKLKDGVASGGQDNHEKPLTSKTECDGGQGWHSLCWLRSGVGAIVLTNTTGGFCRLEEGVGVESLVLTYAHSCLSVWTFRESLGSTRCGGGRAGVVGERRVGAEDERRRGLIDLMDNKPHKIGGGGDSQG